MADANFLRASQLAAIFDVDLKTIHNWHDRGQIPGTKTPGRHLRFDAVEVKEACERQGIGVPPKLIAFIAGDQTHAPPPRGYLQRASTDSLKNELTRRGFRVDSAGASS